jgi:hypothetical protein
MALRTASTVKDAALDGITALADGGSIEFRTGSRPSNVTDSATGTLLASVDFAATAFDSASNGAATANGVPLETTGLDDGDIGYARIVDSGGNAIWDTDSVGTSGTEVVVNTLTVSTGVNFAITAYTFTASDPS